MEARTMMLPSTRSADELVRRALASPERVEALRQNPEGVLRELAREVTRDVTSDQDPWLYRMIVLIIGLTALIAVVGAVVISASGPDRQVPDILTALGSGAIGALAGFLTPFQHRR
jgi:hypothetical protein